MQLTIQLPEGFNFPQQHIMFVFIEEDLSYGLSDSPRYIRLIRDQDPFHTYSSLDDWIDAETPSLWLDKYGELPPPDKHLYGIWAETLNPNTIPYDGPTRLTDTEQVTICNFVEGVRVDLTMAMLYVMIEGLNWRPGAGISKGTWPSQQEMLTFYHHYATPIYDDPRGALHIALSLLFTEVDGHRHIMWDELEAVVQSVHVEYWALMEQADQADH